MFNVVIIYNTSTLILFFFMLELVLFFCSFALYIASVVYIYIYILFLFIYLLIHYYIHTEGQVICSPRLQENSKYSNIVKYYFSLK